MTEIKLVMPIYCHYEEHQNKVREVFSDFTLKWSFEGFAPCVFHTTISNEPRSEDHEELRIFPMSVSFCCSIPVATKEGNDIFWLDSDESVYDEWEEFHFYELRRLYMALTLLKFQKPYMPRCY